MKPSRMATKEELAELKDFIFTPPSEILEDVEEFYDVEEDGDGG